MFGWFSGNNSTKQLKMDRHPQHQEKWDEWRRSSSNTQTPTFSSTLTLVHTLKGILGPCGAAREQPSVSCVCSEAGEGRPAPPKESSDPGKWEKGGVLCGKAKAWRGEKRATNKTAFLQRERETERDTEREKGRERERERGGGSWNNAPSAAGAMAKAVCVCVCVCECVCREHFLFCVN